MQSLPLRERGLKSGNLTDTRKESVVAPLAGAWIEMYALGVSERKRVVAPLAGAWIEICAPGGARFLRVKVPNPPGSGKDIAEGKGAHCEVGSEGSRMWGNY